MCWQLKISKLFISCQSRECGLNEVFFRNENHTFSASLSDGGKLHTCETSHITNILETFVILAESEPDGYTLVIYGSVVLNTLSRRSSGTFEEYATLDVLSTIQIHYAKHNRTDRHCVQRMRIVQIV